MAKRSQKEGKEGKEMIFHPSLFCIFFLSHLLLPSFPQINILIPNIQRQQRGKSCCKSHSLFHCCNDDLAVCLFVVSVFGLFCSLASSQVFSLLSLRSFRRNDFVVSRAHPQPSVFYHPQLHSFYSVSSFLFSMT